MSIYEVYCYIGREWVRYDSIGEKVGKPFCDEKLIV